MLDSCSQSGPLDGVLAGEARHGSIVPTGRVRSCVLIKSGEPKSRVNGRPCGKRPKRTFAEVMVEWATSIEASVSAKTVQRYACSSEPYLKGKMLHEVSRRFIADVVLGATLPSTMQPSTRSQYPPYFIRPRPQLVPSHPRWSQ
jgi:hypothetical protein